MSYNESIKDKLKLLIEKRNSMGADRNDNKKEPISLLSLRRSQKMQRSALALSKELRQSSSRAIS
jgi:hypothetical protein